MAILLYVPIRAPGEKVVPGMSAASLILILCTEIREPEKDWSPETSCYSIVNDCTCSNNGSGIDHQRLAVVVLRVVGVQIRLGGHRRTFCHSVTKGGMCSNKAQ